MISKKEQKEFIEELFITCGKCGYNNKKGRLQVYGTCLRCGDVLDQKAYIKYLLRKKQKWIKEK